MKKALSKGIEFINVDVEKILPNEKQPRKEFRAAALKDFAVYIEEMGMVQPVLLSPVGERDL